MKRIVVVLLLLFYAPVAAIGFYGGITVLVLPWLQWWANRYNAVPPEERRSVEPPATK